MAERIISLIPSATEIIAALGFADSLVARSHECDYPAKVKALPACTAPKFNPHGSSREIDQSVKNILRQSLAVYQVDEELLQKLEPNVIVTQAQCEVCAVSLADVEQAVCKWVNQETKVVSLEPNSLADVWNDIGRVATALKVPEKGQALVANLTKQLAAISAVTEKLVEAEKPSVACIEWLDPLMAAGNWVPELVELAGGRNLFGTAGQHSPWLTFEELQAAQPDVIVVMPCGFDIERIRAETQLLTTLPGWENLRAVQNKWVYVTDGNQYFNRPGPRLVESAQILAEIFHPDLFEFGHEGSGWQAF